MEIRHYTYDNDVWFQGNSVAAYFQYQNCHEAVYDLVDASNKISYDALSSKLSQTNFSVDNMQPHTVFINEILRWFGVYTLLGIVKKMQEQKKLKRNQKDRLNKTFSFHCFQHS